ncbi:MAG: glycosyltransferase family 39 protein [Verrucomicrobiota bacterium]
MTNTDALPLDSPMLPPLVLRPPLGPGIVRALLLALAAIFHVLTAGWSPIQNGPEGELAGAARALLQNGLWDPLSSGVDWSGAPLALWLTKASMAVFGINEFAARLPTALGVVAAVWFTFRLGERFGGIWRGFAAGTILLCSPGMFTVARTLTPAPLATAFLVSCFYCLVRGFEHRPVRRPWFFLAWGAWALSYFSGGWQTAAIPLVTALLLSLCVREARMRFPALLSWEGMLIIALTVAGATAMHVRTSWGAMPTGICPAVSASRMIGWQIGFLFPWSLLLVPAAFAACARLAKMRPLEWPAVFPLAWAFVALAAALGNPARSFPDTLNVWPAVALWGALCFETMPRKHFLRWTAAVVFMAFLGLILTHRLALVLGKLCPFKAELIRGIPAFFWPSITSVAFIAVLAFALFGATAFWLEWHHRRRFALMALFGAMIPAGYAFADASAKIAPYFSFADFAHCIRGTAENAPRVFVDASPSGASSLRFYLEQPFTVTTEPDMIKPLWVADTGRAYLVTRQSRVANWKDALDGRFRVACEAGANVLLTNAVESGQGF